MDYFPFYLHPTFHITLVTETHERLFVSSAAVAICIQRSHCAQCHMHSS
jgi:hypothetical protein